MTVLSSCFFTLLSESSSMYYVFTLLLPFCLILWLSDIILYEITVHFFFVSAFIRYYSYDVM